MKIRLARIVLDDDNRVDVHAWNVQVLADIPVGVCGCGSSAYGQKIVRGHRLLFATAVCPACGTEAVAPIPVAVAARSGT